MHSSRKSKLLPQQRAIQKAVLATGQGTQTLERTRRIQTMLTASPSVAGAAARLGGVAAAGSSTQLVVVDNGTGGDSPGEHAMSAAELVAQQAADPLVILRCDRGHAPHVTHLHLARRSLGTLHPHLLLFVNLEELWLNDNALTELRGVAPPPQHHYLAVPQGCLRLKRLFLSRNRFSTFAGSDLCRLPHLEVLMLADNRLANLEVVSQQLSVLAALKQLDLSGNPLAEERHYREYMIANHPSLEVLDKHTITRAERDKALTMFPPSQVSRSRSSASVAFGSCVHPEHITSAASSMNNNNINNSQAEKSTASAVGGGGVFGSPFGGGGAQSTASGATYATTRKSNNNNAAASIKSTGSSGAGGGASAAAFISPMAAVLETRAHNVRMKREAEEAALRMQEDKVVKERTSQQARFHRKWTRSATRAIVSESSGAIQKLADQAASAGAKEANSTQVQQQALVQQQQQAVGQQRDIASAVSLPPINAHGVSSQLFERGNRPDAYRKSATATAAAASSAGASRATLMMRKNRFKSTTMPADDDSSSSESDDDVLNMRMERDVTVFSRCLDASEEEQARDAQRRKEVEAAALDESEARAIRSSFPAGTAYVIRDVCARLVIDILGGQIAAATSGGAAAASSDQQIQLLTKHFLADAKNRHGRMDGEHVVRVLLAFRPFVQLRVEQLYQKSEACVRSHPEQAVLLLRRISCLNDYLKESAPQQQAAGGGSAPRQHQTVGSAVLATDMAWPEPDENERP